MPFSGELHQLREAGEVGLIFFIYVRARLRHCRLRGDFFEGVVMFRRVCQRGARILQQFRFCAALLVIWVHHHAGRRAAQVDTRLQHQIEVVVSSLCCIRKSFEAAKLSLVLF